MEQINKQLRQFLTTHPEDPEITDYINSMRPKIRPTLRLHQINLKQQKQAIEVYAHLMVQDIRDNEYYYSFIGKRPLHENSQYYLLKYGNNPNYQTHEDILENQDYIKVMTDRQIVICTPVKYQSRWVDELENRQNLLEKIEMFVDGKVDFKLGEVFHVVAMYYPDLNQLHFIRKVEPEEIELEKLDSLAILQTRQIKEEETRKQILTYFATFSSSTYAHYLLFSLISQDCFFLSCDLNIEEIIREIYPRICNLELKVPFEDSLFPWKNSQDELISTPMQMSSLPTYVILDFSKFSEKQQVVIHEKQIDNIKALKVFVEEESTIYRWEIGESLVPHKHSGLIIKATNIITPQFSLLEEKINLEKIIPLKEQQKDRFRIYIQKARVKYPKLSDDERKLIEKYLSQSTQKQKVAKQLAKIMRLAKLIAQSQLRDEITFNNFLQIIKLVGLEKSE